MRKNSGNAQRAFQQNPCHEHPPLKILHATQVNNVETRFVATTQETTPSTENNLHKQLALTLSLSLSLSLCQLFAYSTGKMGHFCANCALLWVFLLGERVPCACMRNHGFHQAEIV